jgi:lysozyme
MTTVVDLSHYQAGFDFAAFKAAGGLAAILKASQGTTSADPSYATFVAAAKAAGIATASYHYLTTDPAATQASWFLACAKPLEGARVCADWEGVGVTAAQAVQFLEAVAQARPDLELTIYTNSSNAAANIDSASAAWLSASTALWIAEYGVASPSLPLNIWKTWSLWQYSGSGSVAGFTGAVDLDQFNGSNANLLKWFGPSAAPAPALPTPTPPVAGSSTIAISISAPAGVNVTVNGVAIPSA